MRWRSSEDERMRISHGKCFSYIVSVYALVFFRRVPNPENKKNTHEKRKSFTYCNAYFLMYVYLCNLLMHPEQAKRGSFSDKGRVVSLVK